MGDTMEIRILVASARHAGAIKTMAEELAEGVRIAGGMVDVADVAAVRAANLLDYHGYAFGSPPQYGMPAATMAKLFDDSVMVHGRLAGRVATAFSCERHAGGGGESACLSILASCMVHGMMVFGSAQGGHYGPVATGEPDDACLRQCRAQGERLATMARVLACARRGEAFA